MESNMGKSSSFKVQYNSEDGDTVVDGQQHHTRKSAKHRVKQLSNNNFKLSNFVIVHPNGEQESISFE